MFDARSLHYLIRNSDQQNVLWHELCEALEDHGGSIAHLDALLSDVNSPRVLLKKLAKLIVGDIWRFVEEPIDLGLTTDHFNCPPKEFVSGYRNLRLDREFADGMFSETVPTHACRYQLHHFKRSMSLDEIAHAFQQSSRLTEPASWRELMAYVARLRPDDFCHCSIIAAGSRLFCELTGGHKIETEQFPSACGQANGVVVEGENLERADDFKLSPKHFYLMRIYS